MVLEFVGSYLDLEYKSRVLRPIIIRHILKGSIGAVPVLVDVCR